MFHSITQSAMLKPRLLRKALEVTQKLCLPGMHRDFRASPVQATAEGQAREAAKTRYTLHACSGCLSGSKHAAAGPNRRSSRWLS